MDVGQTAMDALKGAALGSVGGPVGIAMGLVSGVAPDLIAAFIPHLAGPQGALIASSVMQTVASVTGAQDPTPAAITGLGPDAKADLQGKLAALVVQAEQGRQADAASARVDVQSARAQTSTLMQAHSLLGYGSTIVSIVIVIAFGVATYFTLTGKLAGSDQSFASILVGTLAAMATQVANFWLGSSSSSRSKDIALANSMPVLPQVPPVK